MSTEKAESSNENRFQNVDDDPTCWKESWDVDAIPVIDPTAEVLGIVDPGDPLYVTFREVVKMTGHACPAVAGAYRATQIGLEELYPSSYPVRGDIGVTVGDPPETPGVGPMTNVVSFITGAEDERGFKGFNGYGSKQDLLSFGQVPGHGRSFEFSRTDRNEAIRVHFTPNIKKEEQEKMAEVSKVAQGDISDKQRKGFLEKWHTKVQQVLDSTPGDQSPFTVEEA